MSSALAVNNYFNSLFNAGLLITIIYVTYRNILEYKKLTQKKKALLFSFGVILNTACFLCLSVLFWKSFSQLVGATYNGTNPLFFACNMVFFQHSFLICVLFIRIYFIFNHTDLSLSLRTKVLFVISFIFSTSIFMGILFGKIRVPNTDYWVNCAVTLCIFNVIFMITITSLFLTKLTIVFRRAMETKRANAKDTALINLITKTALLSLITMSITFFSCVLLLFRFSIFGKNPTVSTISDWVISIDIYSNFLCYSLSFKYYKSQYSKLCKCCDSKCKQLFFCILFGAADTDKARKFLSEMVVESQIKVLSTSRDHSHLSTPKIAALSSTSSRSRHSPVHDTESHRYSAKEVSSRELLESNQMKPVDDTVLYISDEDREIQSTYANSAAVLKSFWTSKVNSLSDDKYNTLALNFYNNAFEAMPEGRQILVSRITNTEAQSKIWWGMFQWLISTVTGLGSPDVLHKISILGKAHVEMGVKLEYYLQMGGAFHKTLSDYFGKEYTLRVRYCFNTLYETVVNIMMGLDFRNKCTQQKDEMAAFREHINDLMYCLGNDSALEYLSLYMKQQFCGELALFYKDYKMYKAMSNGEERNEKGKEITKLYIDKRSEREINISHKHEKEFRVYLKKNGYDDTIFDVISKEVVGVISNDCFPDFIKEIKKLYDEINDNTSLDAEEKDDQNWAFLTNRESVTDGNVEP